VSFTRTANLKTDYSRGAKSAGVNTTASITTDTRRPREETTVMKKAIAQLVASSRNAVPNAKGGEQKVSSENIPLIETDFVIGALTASVSINADITGKTEGL
jgi:hypothetical protein